MYLCHWNQNKQKPFKTIKNEILILTRLLDDFLNLINDPRNVESLIKVNTEILSLLNFDKI